MSHAELTALVVYLTAMTFSPGPNTALSAAIASRHGLPSAMRFVASVPFGWCLLLLTSSLAMAVGMQMQSTLRTALVLGAVVYVLWLARQLWRRDRLVGVDAARLDVGFLKGIGLQFVNGKAWLNALTVSATWVSVEGELVARLGLVLPVMMVFGFTSNLTYAVVGSALRSWLAHGRRLLLFNRSLAVLIGMTACWMLWTSGLLESVASGVGG